MPAWDSHCPHSHHVIYGCRYASRQLGHGSPKPSRWAQLIAEVLVLEVLSADCNLCLAATQHRGLVPT